MSDSLPTVDEIGQLAELRRLQVRRAQQTCIAAERECEKTARAVRERNARIAAIDREIEALARRTVNEYARSLPRWARLGDAHRARLLDRHEREAFALSDEEAEHAQACEQLSRARAQLSRARHREDVTNDIAAQVHTKRRNEIEKMVEAETDDTFGAAIAACVRQT